jgi:hypothetical protein
MSVNDGITKSVSFADPTNLLVCQGAYHLTYNIESGYFNASQLARHMRATTSVAIVYSLERWKETYLAKQFYDFLKKDYIEPEREQNGDTYLHASLLPHFVTWFGAQFNRPYCQLLECALGHIVAEGIDRVNYHAVAFFDVDNGKRNNLHQYYIMECKISEVESKTVKLLAQHPHMTRIFFHQRIPDTVGVINNLHADFDLGGKISINSNHYCGSLMTEAGVLEHLFKLCEVEERPEVMRSSYDAVYTTVL